MINFLSQEQKDATFELLIDTKIFHKDIILKAAYNLLDRGYFFFKFDADNNIILQFHPKEDTIEASEKIIGDYSDELLNVYLRDALEKENKSIREAIIGAAIGNSLDTKWFVSIDTGNTQQATPIDFDKDIADILKEIENDPKIKIDEEELQKILKEIEEESAHATVVPKISINPNEIENAKKKFQDRK